MQILKIEIFDEDVDCPELDDLAIEISEGYHFDNYPAAHVKVTNEATGEVYEVDPHKQGEIKAKWEDCSNGWMCSNCKRSSTYDFCKCPYCGSTMINGTIDKFS